MAPTSTGAFGTCCVRQHLEIGFACLNVPEDVRHSVRVADAAVPPDGAQLIERPNVIAVTGNAAALLLIQPTGSAVIGRVHRAASCRQPLAQAGKVEILGEEIGQPLPGNARIIAAEQRVVEQRRGASEPLRPHPDDITHHRHVADAGLTGVRHELVRRLLSPHAGAIPQLEVARASESIWCCEQHRAACGIGVECRAEPVLFGPGACDAPGRASVGAFPDRHVDGTADTLEGAGILSPAGNPACRADRREVLHGHDAVHARVVGEVDVGPRRAAVGGAQQSSLAIETVRCRRAGRNFGGHDAAVCVNEQHGTVADGCNHRHLRVDPRTDPGPVRATVRRPPQFARHRRDAAISEQDESELVAHEVRRPDVVTRVPPRRRITRQVFPVVLQVEGGVRDVPGHVDDAAAGRERERVVTGRFDVHQRHRAIRHVRDCEGAVVPVRGRHHVRDEVRAFDAHLGPDQVGPVPAVAGR